MSLGRASQRVPTYDFLYQRKVRVEQSIREPKQSSSLLVVIWGKENVLKNIRITVTGLVVRVADIIDTDPEGE